MSHEIRTPLNAILGFAQLLGRDPALTGTQREHVRIIGRSGEHLLVLINDILEMSKIEAQQVTLKPVPFDLRVLARDLHAMFASAAAAKGLQFTVETSPDLPALVVGDQGKLRQILVNLLGNALKFTSRGYVALRLHAFSQPRNGRRLLAEVEDSGPGIDPNEAGQLFQPFEQTALGRKNNSGTGLGLAISRQFARLMGGDISLESEVGKGSNFRVEVQIGEAEPAAGAPEGRPAHPEALGMPDARARRVLVVDDLADNRRLLCEMLSPAGCEIREASGGAEAFALFNAWQPHLILMDLRMPGMDGFDAIRRVRAHGAGREVKIICHSASVFSEDRDQAFAAGADDFISKPFREEVLWDKLRTLLDLPDGPSPDPGANAAVATALPVGPHQPLSPELENNLRQAVLELDMDRIMTLIAQVTALDPALAERLTALATQFDYDGLAALLSSAGESPAV